jgi:hypothetical protein
MPSTIADFQLPIKKVSSQVRIADDFSQSFNGQPNNVWSTPVTFSTSNGERKLRLNGFNTEFLHKNNWIEYSCNSLRIFESGNPRSFSIEGANTDTSVIIIDFVNPFSTPKTITIEYGNAGLPIVSVPPLSVSNKITARFCPRFDRNLYDKYKVFGYLGNIYKDQGKSVEYDQFWGSSSSAYISPNLVEVDFNGGASGVQNQVIKFNKAYSPSQSLLDGIKPYEFPLRTVFIVAKHLDSGCNTLIGGKTYDMEIRINNDRLEVNSVFSAVIQSPAITLAQGVDNLIMVQYTGTQVITKINGGTAQTTAYSGGFSQGGLVLGASLQEIITNNTTLTHHNGSIREVMIFDTVLTTTEITEVEKYMEITHSTVTRPYIPNPNYGTTSFISNQTHNAISYAPVTSFVRKESLENLSGITNESTAVQFQNVFKKTIFSGVSPENWTTNARLSYYTPESDQVPANFSYGRKMQVNSTSLTDMTTFEAINPATGLDINSLIFFNLDNDVESTFYESDSNDYIALFFFCADVSKLDLANCFIQISDSGGFNTLQSSFTNSINTIISNQTTRVKVLKSTFTGSGSFSTAQRIAVVLKCLAGQTVDAYYANCELIKNFKSDLELTQDQPMTLANSVSSDDGLSYYTATINSGVIKQRQMSSDDFILEYQSYLDKVKDRTFESLPSWPAGFDSIVYSYKDITSAVFGKKQYFYSYFLKKTLAFVFPFALFDVNLDMLTGTDTTTLLSCTTAQIDGQINNLNYFVINANEKVGDVINKLLNPVFGTLTSDNVARGLYDNPTAYIVNPSQIEDEGYIQDLTPKTVFNQIELIPYFDEWASYLLKVEGLTTVKANSTASHIVDIDTYNESKKMGYNEASEFGQIVGTDIIVENEVSSYPAGNDKIFVYSKKNGNKVEIKIVNENTFDIEPSLVLKGAMVAYQRVRQPNRIDTKFLKNEASIKKNSVNQYPLNNFYSYIGTNLATQEISQAQIYQDIMDKYAVDKEIFQVRMIFDPSLKVGLKVSIKNSEDRTVVGTIISIENVSEGENQSQLITVREI